MNKRLAWVGGTAFVCALQFAGQTQAQAVAAASFATSASIDGIAASIRQQANAIIQQLETSVGISSFMLRQDVTFAADDAAYQATQLQGKTFKDLNATQRDFFTQTQSLLNNAQRVEHKTAADMDSVAGTLESGIARLPFADKSPRISSATPQYILSAEKQDAVNITVHGSLLGTPLPKMTVGASVCRMIQQTDRDLTFSCPATRYVAVSQINSVSANLQMTVTPPWYYSLIGRKLPPKIYSILTYVVPPILGSYHLDGQYVTNQRIVYPRVGKISASNAACDGQTTRGPFTFLPHAAGWMIDPTSIHLGGETSGNQGRSVNGPQAVTQNGFFYTVTLTNGGHCVKAFGQIITADARAWEDIPVLWNDIQQQPKTNNVSSEAGQLLWNTDEAISLPEGVIWIKLTVDQIDGKKKIVTFNQDT